MSAFKRLPRWQGSLTESQLQPKQALSGPSGVVPNSDTPGIIRLYKSKLANASETSDKIKILSELHEKLLAHLNSQNNHKNDNKKEVKAPNQYSDTDSASSILSHLFLGSMNEYEMDAAFDFIADQLMKIKEHLVQLKTSVMQAAPPMFAVAEANEFQNQLDAAHGTELQFDVLSELIHAVQGKTAIRAIERAQLNQLCDDQNPENMDRLANGFNKMKLKWAETEAMTKLLDKQLEKIH